MPVSALRCWDWKKTASSPPQAGQVLLERGSCELEEFVSQQFLEDVDGCVYVSIGKRHHSGSSTAASRHIFQYEK